jgi:cytochrome c biogenesis protein CcmG, thiol:disulfide interchange protein DsbE
MKKWFLTLALCLTGLSNAAPRENRVLLDLAAPEFLLTSHEGKIVQLENFKGKPVVLNFWASWCGPCRGEFPGLHTIWLRNKAQVEFLAVAISEPRETSLKFMRDSKYTFTILTDPDSQGSTEPTKEVAKRYGIQAIPTTYFIDANGIVRRTVLGGMNTLDFREYLREIGVNDLGR